ncbi:MAG: SDR family NAD(P)-dependent oxidoreductase [Clostridiales bacterium]|nr:SDR family NAD(P)-dependent oxidoreductase [Clostridiales bacterium]
MKRLIGKVAIVTGANSGMGMATAKALLDEGATVVMLCRSEERGREAYKKLLADANSRTYLLLADLGDYESIKEFVRMFKKIFQRLDILVNNAGFISLDRQETKEGLERQFGVNHIGHFLLTMSLLDVMGGRLADRQCRIRRT